MGKTSVIYLPDGQQQWLPVAPKTWVDAAAGIPGDALRARLLETDAGSAVAWHRQRPIFQAFASLAQSIPTATFTAITGLSELVDNYAGHSDTTNTGRYLAPNTNSATTGGDWYLCTGYVPYNSNSASTIFIAGLRKNGGGTVQEGSRIPGGAGHVVDTMVCDLVQLNGGSNDYVELVGFQNTGAAVNTSVSGKTPTLTVRWAASDQAWSGFATPALPAVPHTWTGTDVYTGSVTGVSKVPLNTELRDTIRFLHNPPIARVTASGTAQTVPTGAGTWTSIAYTAAGATVDTYGGWAIANPSRYTCQRAGLYLVAGFVSAVEPTTPAGYRACRLLQTFAAGGSQAYAGWTTLPQTTGGSSAGSGIYAVGLLRMAVGDYAEVQMSHTQGAAMSLFPGAGNACRLVAVWMAA